MSSDDVFTGFGKVQLVTPRRGLNLALNFLYICLLLSEFQRNLFFSAFRRLSVLHGCTPHFFCAKDL